MTTEYNILLNKIDEFRRKFYLNKILRGTFLSIIIYVVSFYLFSFIEYLTYFSIPVRTVIFYSLVIFYVFLLIDFVLLPVFQYFKIAKFISDKKSAGLISDYFVEMQDKLLNVLELTDTKEAMYSSELLLASIDQKIRTIKIYNFREAVNLKDNYRFIKYFALLFFTVLVSFWVSPAWTDGSRRLLNYNVYYEPKIPIKFGILNDSLYVKRNNEFTLNLKVDGDYIPKEVYINYNGNTYLMSRPQPKEKNILTYTLKNISSDTKLFFSADEYRSKDYELIYLPPPAIMNFYMKENIPAYTKEINKDLKNVGDIVIPEGSVLTYSFDVKNIDSLYFKVGELYFPCEKTGEGFNYSFTAKKNEKYSIVGTNKYFNRQPLLNYTLTVIPDLFPGIDIKLASDSTSVTKFNYAGSVSDDYGFRKLTFNYSIYEKDDKTPTLKYTSVELPIDLSLSTQNFMFSFDFALLNVTSEQAIKYYFEIHDNDGVNGSKATKSQTFEYKPLSAKEINALVDKSMNDVESGIAESKRIANEIQNDLNKLQQKSLSDNVTNWEKSQMLKSIMDKQARLDDLIKKIQKENEAKNNIENSMKNQQQELLDKQKQIQQLLDSLLTDDMKKMMEEIQKLQKQFNQSNFNQLQKDMQYNYKDFTNQLDRNLELLKKYQMEQKLKQTAEQMNDLAEKQEKLGEETEKAKDKDSQDIKDKLQEQSDNFNNLSNEFNDMLEKNKELSEPMKLDELKEEREEIKSNFNQENQQMQQEKNKKASKTMKDNAKKIKEVGEKMQDMLEKNTEEEKAENEEDLRQIMDNLLKLSFDQENLMKRTSEVSVNDPTYLELANQQKNLQEDYKIVKDSLLALSKRAPQIGTPVNKELNAIFSNIDKANAAFNARSLSNITKNEQFIMTSTNNLALLLSEILDQMQNQDANSSSGGSKSKPSKGKKSKPGFSDLKKSQESLKQQMEKMLQQLKDGMKDGDKQGQNGKNKQLAQTLAQQEIFQQMLNDLINKTTLSPDAQKQLNEINKLIEQNKNDLVNKNISPEMQIRNQKIMTRLLEAEKAQNQRDQDDKRESKESDEKYKNDPKFILKIQKDKFSTKENLNFDNLKLYNFYKTRYDIYLKQIIK